LQDENSAQEMGYVMRVLDHYVEDYGVSVVVIHHTKKPGVDGPYRGGDALRGSSAVFADVDTLLQVERLSAEHVKEPLLQVTYEMRRGEPVDPMVFKRLRSGEVVYMGEEYMFARPDAAPRRNKYSKV
jgi:hypothetical protein